METSAARRLSLRRHSGAAIFLALVLITISGIAYTTTTSSRPVPTETITNVVAAPDVELMNSSTIIHAGVPTLFLFRVSSPSSGGFIIDIARAGDTPGPFEVIMGVNPDLPYGIKAEFPAGRIFNSTIVGPRVVIFPVILTVPASAPPKVSLAIVVNQYAGTGFSGLSYTFTLQVNNS